MSQFPQDIEQHAIMTMEVVTGEETLQINLNEESPDEQLTFGPYGISPLRGLHFHTAHDTATS